MSKFGKITITKFNIDNCIVLMICCCVINHPNSWLQTAILFMNQPGQSSVWGIQHLLRWLKGSDRTAGGWNQLRAHSHLVVDAVPDRTVLGFWLQTRRPSQHGGWFQAWAHLRKPKWKLYFLEARSQKLVQHHFHYFPLVKIKSPT